MMATSTEAIVVGNKRTSPRTSRFWRVRGNADEAERSIVSRLDRRTGATGWVVKAVVIISLAVLVLGCLGPLLWMVKASLSTTQEINGAPFGWPAELQWQNFETAWNRVGVARFTLNSLIVTSGSVIASVIFTSLMAFVLGVLRPRYAPLLEGLVLATLLVPGVISLVPLYLTIIDLKLLDSYWAVWLPSGASAFSVLLATQFMRGIPREIFEAGRIDGAGPWRLLVLIALPMSKPILGVIAVLAFVESWKDFLWPLLALPSSDHQPLSVGLSKVADTTDQAALMAAMVIAISVPVAIFLIFQKQFLRGAGSSGALKG